MLRKEMFTGYEPKKFSSPTEELFDLVSIPVSHFIGTDHVKELKKLVTKGADLHARNNKNETLLHIATISHNHTDLIAFLLQSGVDDVLAQDQNGRTPIHNACLSNAHPDSINLLAKQIKPSDNIKISVDKEGMTLLHALCSRRFTDSAIKSLINIGVEINAVDNRGRTALHIACFEFNDSVVELLLVSGADVNAVDKNRKTPVHIASERGAEKAIGILSKKGADLNARDSEGKIPFHYALVNGGMPGIIALIDNGAKINELNFSQDSDSSRLYTWFYTLTVFERIKYALPPLTVNASRLLINDGALEYFASTYLGSNKSIVKLSFAENAFSHKGMHALSIAIKENTSLRILDLSFNKIGSRKVKRSGIQDLFSALEKNSGIVKLNLKGCQLDKEDIKTLIKLLKSRKDKQTLKQIELDDDIVATLSEEQKKLLPNEEVNENIYLAHAKLVPMENTHAISFLDVAHQVEQCMPKYKENEWKELKDKLSKKGSVLVSELSIEEIKIWITHEMTIWLREYVPQFLAQDNDLVERNIHYLNALITRFTECVDNVLSENNPQDFILWVNKVKKIIERGQQSAVTEWIKKYDSAYSVERKQELTEIFRESFQLRMVELVTATFTLGSGRVAHEETRSVKMEMLKTGKHVVLALPSIGTIVNSSLELFKTGAHASVALGGILEKVIEFVEDHETDIEAISKIIEHISEIPSVEHGINHLKEKVIRKIHGLTEEEKLKNLVNCFSSSNYLSDIQSIAFTITHHYQDQINSLTPALAKLWGEYVFLHITDLFMSGAIQGRTSSKDAPLKKLTADELGEEAVLWLSYVSPRHRAPKVKVKDNKKISLTEHFLTPKIKFKDSQNKLYTCLVMFKNKKGKFVVQNNKYPARWATQRELIALTKLCDSHINKHQTLPSKTETKHMLIFLGEEEILNLEITSLPLRIEESPYRSQEQKLEDAENMIKHQEVVIERQGKEIIYLKEAEISREKEFQQQKRQLKIVDSHLRSTDGFSYPEYERRYQAAETIQFWYRATRAKNKENPKPEKTVERKLTG